MPGPQCFPSCNLCRVCLVSKVFLINNVKRDEYNEWGRRTLSSPIDRKGESVIQGLPDAGGAASSSSSSSIGLTDPFFSSSSSPLLTQGRAGEEEEELFFSGGRRKKN